jgi:hypothetical protein
VGLVVGIFDWDALGTLLGEKVGPSVEPLVGVCDDIVLGSMLGEKVGL